MIKDALKYLEPNAAIPIDMETTIMLVNALKEALAQPEQEPLIGCVNHDCAKCKERTEQEPAGEIIAVPMGLDGDEIQLRTHFYQEIPPVGAKVYTTPPAQPAPVPTNCRHCGGFGNVLCAGQCKQAAAQPAQRKPLTDEQIDEIYLNSDLDIGRQYNQLYEIARAIEAAHGIGEKK